MTAIAITPINLLDLIDPKKCYALIRFIRWGESVTCPKCGSHLLIKMLDNVQQVTIKPLIEKGVALGTLVYTDEYNIYQRLTQWGYEHKSVCHGIGEYARDEDGDGFHEVHVNSIIWFLVTSAVLAQTAPRDFSG